MVPSISIFPHQPYLPKGYFSGDVLQRRGGKYLVLTQKNEALPLIGFLNKTQKDELRQEVKSEVSTNLGNPILKNICNTLGGSGGPSW